MKVARKSSNSILANPRGTPKITSKRSILPRFTRKLYATLLMSYDRKSTKVSGNERHKEYSYLIRTEALVSCIVERIQFLN